MNYTKQQIANEAITTLANHYNTTTSEVASAISKGNTKLANELNSICEKTLEALYE